jgi:hypothetical protein
LKSGEEMKINVNVRCKVKLTKYGKAVLIKSGKDWVFQHPSVWDEASQTFTTQLWDLMFIFGEVHYIGNQPSFSNNEIEILEG